MPVLPKIDSEVRFVGATPYLFPNSFDGVFTDFANRPDPCGTPTMVPFLPQPTVDPIAR